MVLTRINAESLEALKHKEEETSYEVSSLVSPAGFEPTTF